MSHSTYQEAATRHHPVAHGRDPSAREGVKRLRRPVSEMRLQAAVVVRERDENDPHADVPCTD
jgi:hypothetical protein